MQAFRGFGWWEAAHHVLPRKGDPLDEKTQSGQSTIAPNASAAATANLAVSTRPGGKLGVIIQRLERKAGATADELAEATGWQKHSVLGALSRLRTRGFAMRLEAQGSRKAYRLDRAET